MIPGSLPSPTKPLIVYLIAVAIVLGNWHNVLRAISMASSKSTSLNHETIPLTYAE